ncbi:hypothetical protein SAY87_017295 [Trapa incisa]|uniref:GATA transcription factor n=1 Tax=Trapa incisa TaxID=236973 RepID=A0AAN7QV81_9MYRT|nr:hypothetical protein SAY87_017295 [Trapa incisa]
MTMDVSECYISGGYEAAGAADFSSEKKVGEQFAVDDLLDFSNEDAIASGDAYLDTVAANSTNSSTVTPVDSCNSSLSGGDNQFSGSFGDSSFSGELCVPYDDLAELEWLSNFVEDSFSTKHSLQQPLHAIPRLNSKPTTPESSSSAEPGRPQPADAAASIHHSIFFSETPLPSKSRSKRSRAAPCDWTPHLLHLSPAAATAAAVTATKPPKTAAIKKQREVPGISEPRKCLHCASEKTPQWRTGPMGPKTLCNACGVRYKSGRLVPEYRPAASPTFVSTKHSNSHRKVLELRRQKDMHRVPQHHQFVGQSSIFATGPVEEYLIGHCSGTGFRQLM